MAAPRRTRYRPGPFDGATVILGRFAWQVIAYARTGPFAAP